MRSDEPYIPYFLQVVELNDQTILVARNVENNTAISNNARISVEVLNILRAVPIRTFCGCVPVHQWPHAVGICGLFPKLPDCLKGNYAHQPSHESSLSQYVPILGTTY